MRGLPPGVGVVLERIGEVGDALEALAVGRGERDTGDAEHRQAQAEEPHRGTHHPEHAEQDRREDHRGAEVATDEHQADDGEEPGHHRHEEVVELAQAALLVGVDVGRPQHDGELGHLGGLHGEGADRQPVLVAVDQHAEAGHERQQHQRQQEAGIGQAAHVLDRQARGDPRAREPDRHPQQLALHHGVGVVVEEEGPHAGRAQHHDEPDGQQQRRRAEQQVVGGERLLQRVTHRTRRRGDRVAAPPPRGGDPGPQRRPHTGDGGLGTDGDVLGVRGGHRRGSPPDGGQVWSWRAMWACTASANASPRAP